VVSRAKDTHGTNRAVRMRDEWEDLGEAAGERRRTTVITQLVRWYLRYPGAKLPERPPARDWEARHAERAAEKAERERQEAAGAE
jgi:hypothetical protein